MDTTEQPATLDDTEIDAATTAGPGVVEDAEAAIPDTVAPDEPATAGDGEPDYLAELAIAMRGVAGQQRERLSARAAEDASAQIDEARSKGADDAAALRQVADEDVASIEAWADAEVERLRGEAADRIATRRSELDAAIERNDAIVEDEVGAVERALTDYDASLTSFMAELEGVTDPSALADRASLLPARPDLGQVRDGARAGAIATFAREAGLADDTPAEAPEASTGEAPEASSVADVTADDATTPIGVMDPTAVEATGDRTGRLPWEVQGLVDDPVDGADSDDETPRAEVPEPAAATSGVDGLSAVRLLRTVAPWTAPTSTARETDDPR